MELQDVIDRQKDGRDHESASLLNARRCAASIFLDSSRTRRECSAGRSTPFLPPGTFTPTGVASGASPGFGSKARSRIPPFLFRWAVLFSPPPSPIRGDLKPPPAA